MQSVVNHVKRRQIPAIFQTLNDLKDEFVGKVEESQEGSGDAPLERRSLDGDCKEKDGSEVRVAWPRRRLDRGGLRFGVSNLSIAQDVPELD